MKNFAFALGIGLLAAFITTDEPLAIGSSIPKADVKLKDISGAEISFKESIRKNGVLIMFSCNTCPVVAKYESRTLALGKMALKQDVGVVLVNSNEASRDDGDSYDDMKDYAKKLGYTFNYVIDKNSEMANAFGAVRTPECFLFDKNGKLVYHGAIDDNPNEAAGARPYMEMAIEKMVKGEKIDPPTTRGVGCSIKRN
jgi:peroxiredoxin